MLENWKTKARQLKTDTLALYLAYRDPRVGWQARVFAALVVGYAFSPIDLIPDFIPLLGYLDDLILIPAGVALALKMIPPEVMAECRIAAAEMDKKPKNWTAALVIGLIWAGVLAAAGFGFWKMINP